MTASLPLVVITLCLKTIQVHSQAQCIRGESGGGLPALRNYRANGREDGGIDDSRITRHHQAIIPSYRFDCSNQMCGNITKWGVDVRAEGLNYQPGTGTPYSLDLQVWRPSPTVDDSTGTGCYSLVGNNRFTSISLDGGVAPSLVPSSSNYIMFRPGDVLGVYVEVANGDNDGVVILTTIGDTSTFTRESVWFASITPTMAASRNGDCPYSVGSRGVLNTMTTGAPVISISTTTFPCPSLPSMATTQPTPPPPNPTTESEETPPTTNQRTQEPVDPSEGATGTELKVPTTSETATDLPILSPSESTDFGLITIIGSATAGIVVIILTLIIVIAVAVLLKKHNMKPKKKEGYSVNNAGAVPTTANEAYGLTRHGDGKSEVEENIYNYPEVNVATIEAKQNEAYGTHTDIITTEGNQAYGSANITTEINSAYGQIIDSETADEYDYI